MKLNKEEAVKVAQFTQIELETLGEVLAERIRQQAKWGEQNHPNVSPTITSPHDAFERYKIPSADEARRTCQEFAAAGAVTWTDIALEEFAEAVESAAFATEAVGEVRVTYLEMLREELIQSAAVFTAWSAAVERQIHAELKRRVAEARGETIDIPRRLDEAGK